MIGQWWHSSWLGSENKLLKCGSFSSCRPVMDLLKQRAANVRYHWTRTNVTPFFQFHCGMYFVRPGQWEIPPELFCTVSESRGSVFKIMLHLGCTLVLGQRRRSPIHEAALNSSCHGYLLVDAYFPVQVFLILCKKRLCHTVVVYRSFSKSTKFVRKLRASSTYAHTCNTGADL